MTKDDLEKKNKELEQKNELLREQKATLDGKLAAIRAIMDFTGEVNI